MQRDAVRVVVDQTLPLEEAAKAHELSATRRIRGKIVLTVDGPRGR